MSAKQPKNAWRQYVLVRARSLKADADIAALSATEAQAPTLAAIADHLGKACEVAVEPGTFRDWLRGRQVEAAWFSVHHAEALLVTLVTPAEAWARLPEVFSVARSFLPSDDPIRTHLEHGYAYALTASEPKTALTAADQEFLAEVLRNAYFLNAVGYGRVRSFRNGLLGASVALSLLVAGLLWVGSMHPTAIPVCFTPVPTASASPAPVPVTPDENAALVCPTGKRSSKDANDNTQKGGDLLLVALIGASGAGLAAARALSTRNELPTRYSPILAQTLLKFPSGVITAVFGVVALRADFVPGVSGFDNQAGILMWALVFGFAQQTLTGLLDDRGQSLLADASPTTPADHPPAAR